MRWYERPQDGAQETDVTAYAGVVSESVPVDEGIGGRDWWEPCVVSSLFGGVSKVRRHVGRREGDICIIWKEAASLCDEEPEKKI